MPFTRGRERSRPLGSVLDEVRRLRDDGYKDVLLLGQNVNRWAGIDDNLEQMFVLVIFASGSIPTPQKTTRLTHAGMGACAHGSLS